MVASQFMRYSDVKCILIIHISSPKLQTENVSRPSSLKKQIIFVSLPNSGPSKNEKKGNGEEIS